MKSKKCKVKKIRARDVRNSITADAFKRELQLRDQKEQ